MENLDLFVLVYVRITKKDITRMLGVSLFCANRYMSDIKKEYNIKRVCLGHLINYFNLPYDTAVKYSKLLKNTQK